MKKLLISSIAIVLALVGSRFLSIGTFWSIVPCAVAAFLCGSFSRRWKEALTNGAVFGFILTFVFMWSSYSGEDSVVYNFPFFTMLGLFGGFWSLILAVVGFFLGKTFQQEKLWGEKNKLKSKRQIRSSATRKKAN